MNHPKPEEWVPYVYGEANGTARRELSAHLQDCRQCRDQIDAWKSSLNLLNAWKVGRRLPARPRLGAPLVKWAAAAAIVLLAGVLIGRATAPKIDPENLRQTITTDIRRDLTQQLDQLVRQEVVRNAALTLDSGHRYTDQVAQQLYVLLKKDVDTVAFNADAGLRNTALQLFQLADYKQPENPVDQNQ
jgi:hypothetical protein